MSGFLALRARFARTSLAWRCSILILIVGAAILGPAAGAAWLASRAWSDQRIIDRVDSALAAIATANPAEDHPEELGHAALAARAGALRWVGVLTADGACTELLDRTGMPKDEIAAQLASATDETAARPLVIELAPSAQFELLTWRPSGSDVTIGAIVDRSMSPAPATWPRTAIAVLGLAVVLGLILALTWVRCVIVGPLEALSRRLSIPHPGLLPSLPVLAVPDELEGVACTVASLAKDVERWRVEAGYLRHTIEATVDARARNAELAADRARREAETDELTRLGNRRYLDRELQRLFDEHAHRQSELALLVIDVDHFKKLNDTRGHQAGDALIAFIGELLGSITRRGMDVAARLGGDEFVVVLPGASAEHALAVGQRVAAMFAQRVRTLGSLEPAPALSIGIALRRQHGAYTPAALLRLADVAMYYAKRSGRGVALVPPRVAMRSRGIREGRK